MSNKKGNNVTVDNKDKIGWIENNVGEDLRSGKMTIQELQNNVLGVNSSTFDFSKAIKNKEKHEEAIKLINENDDF